MRSRWWVLAMVMAPSAAWAQIAPECQDFPEITDYNEQSQQDFLSNYTTLGTSFSPMHAPIPHQPGHGSIGIGLSVLPPLGCARRLVLNQTKTEDPNKTPIVPRPYLSFAFPAIGPMVLYGGVGWIPPVPLLGTRNNILSGELGAGFYLGPKFTAGLRLHATVHKTVAEIATPFDENDPAVDDLYLGSSFGVDGMFGYSIIGGRVDEGEERPDLELSPYVAVGFTDVSTFFYIGDDSVVGNNYHPYAGLAFSVGLDGLVWGRFRWGAEFYGAPGGYSTPDPSVESVTPASRYGHIYTGRFRLGVEI